MRYLHLAFWMMFMHIITLGIAGLVSGPMFDLFSGIYMDTFDYLYQISFILTPKIVYYASALYYVKFVIVMCIKYCLLSRNTCSFVRPTVGYS